MAVKIALISGMRGGKDTFAEPLIRQYQIQELKFASGITELIKVYFPSKLKEGKPRELYQHLGQYMRSIDPDVWVNDLDWWYIYWKERNVRDYIITDVRQPNEVQWCRDNEFTLVRINTPDEIRKQRIIDCGDQFESEQFYHETEQHINEYTVDYEIDGNCSKEELQQKALELYEKLKQEEQ